MYFVMKPLGRWVINKYGVPPMLHCMLHDALDPEKRDRKSSWRIAVALYEYAKFFLTGKES